MAVKKTRIKYEDAVQNLYNSTEYRTVLNNIDNLLEMYKKSKISGFVIISKEDIITLFENWSMKDFEIKIKKNGEGIFHISLVKKTKLDHDVIKGDFLILKHQIQNNIYILVTHENVHFFNGGIMSFFNRFYPLISRTFLDSLYIQKLLVNLESGLSDDKIRITRLVTKSWVKNIDAKKRVESDVKWTDLPFREAFQKVLDNEEWIKSIDFTISRDPNKRDLTIPSVFTSSKLFKIYRDTRFQCSSNFSQFFDRIIEGMVNKAAESFTMFDNRARTKEENFETKPLAIEYDIDIFKEKSQNKRLIDVLQGIKNSSLSVFHANPYLHVSYVDYHDGSSYDIWVLSNNKISIIPQIRSTPAALDRLCEGIFTGFREGTIKEFGG